MVSRYAQLQELMLCMGDILDTFIAHDKLHYNSSTCGIAQAIPSQENIHILMKLTHESGTHSNELV